MDTPEGAPRTGGEERPARRRGSRPWWHALLFVLLLLAGLAPIVLAWWGQDLLRGLDDAWEDAWLDRHPEVASQMSDLPMSEEFDPEAQGRSGGGARDGDYSEPWDLSAPTTGVDEDWGISAPASVILRLRAGADPIGDHLFAAYKPGDDQGSSADLPADSGAWGPLITTADSRHEVVFDAPQSGDSSAFTSLHLGPGTSLVTLRARTYTVDGVLHPSSPLVPRLVARPPSREAGAEPSEVTPRDIEADGTPYTPVALHGELVGHHFVTIYAYVVPTGMAEPSKLLVRVDRTSDSGVLAAYLTMPGHRTPTVTD